MKMALVFLLLLAGGNSISQAVTAAWIQNIDSTEFKLFYHKNHLPKAFYKIQGIRKQKELANAADFYSPSCVGRIRGQLNWIAKHDDNYVISITRGGSAVVTIVYFLDHDTGKLRAYSTTKRSTSDITFSQIPGFLQSGENGVEELDPADFK